jgi:hypothetical protein
MASTLETPVPGPEPNIEVEVDSEVGILCSKLEEGLSDRDRDRS